MNFVILEKTSSVGGTWCENKYPGVACDVPSHLYSYSFFPNPWWTRKYSAGDEIQKYLENVVEYFNLYPNIKFNKEVAHCKWDDVTKLWTVTTKDGEKFVGNFVLSGAGALHIPNVPNFNGE